MDIDVVVIGAGFSGIGAGIKLREAGFHDFVILEQADDLGGTWRDNVYPGVAVDITSFTYSFSFEQNPGWSRVFAPGGELQAYARHCADKYGVRPHMRFGVRVTRATFDADRDRWRVETAGAGTFAARYVISATGGLTQPKWPDIPGLSSFGGQIMHTARWDDGIALRGRRVGIIGTGATAVQVVPAIAPEVAQLHVFQRTPIWIVPKPDRPIPAWLQRTFRALPWTQSGVRLATTAATEAVMVLGVVYNRQLPGVVRAAERLCLRHLERQIPDPALRAKLTPQYGFGCKRPSFSNEFYPAFNRDNVELVTDGIDRVVPTGIVTRDGRRRPLDVLILATGFKVFDPGNLPTYPVIGRDGVDLAAFWDEHRYQAYQGATVPGFPNYFAVLGPYSVNGASWFSMVEAQTIHALRCLKEARRRGATRVEISREANDRFFRWVQRRQPNTVFFNNNCGEANSYYFDRHGDAPFLRPSSGLEMWWAARHFPLRDYRFTATPGAA